MTATAIPADNTHQARPERAVTGVNPLRARDRVRDLLRRELLTPADLVAPVLVQPDHRDPADYRHLPGAVAVSEVATHARALRDVGVRAVKLFVYVGNKTSDAAEALDPNNLLVVAVQAIRATVEDMVISTEVCGCAWTDTGECVLLGVHSRTDTHATYELMARMAVLHAQAGADIIGPAAVLDGSVRAIRAELNDAGYRDVGITPSVIFDSALFTAYKDAMHTDPGRGNRRGFQIDACHTGQALDQAARWLDEGADSLLVQPAMVSVDVLTRLRNAVNVPLTSFSVSGEDQLFAKAPDAVYVEYVRSLKRAGADLIMTYGALRLARAVAKDGAA
jgi:porphobilinogen synthase